MLHVYDLATAVARIDRLFGGPASRVDASALDRGCARCFSDPEDALLRSGNALLPDQLVERVAAKDPTHWSDQPALVRRVLPQLVRLLADGRATDARWCARGLVAAGWHGWPDDQRRSVEGFLTTWWRHTLRTAPSFGRIREVFTSCAIASLTVRPWLDVWDEEATQSASVRELRARCIEDWHEDLARYGSTFPCWWGPDGSEERAVEALTAWMLDPGGRAHPR